MQHVSSSEIVMLEEGEGGAELRLSLSSGGWGGGGGLPPFCMRAGGGLLNAWQRAIETSVGLLEDVYRTRARAGEEEPPHPPSQLLPLREEAVEVELNQLFCPTFEGCAGEVREAIDSLDPLLEACASKLRAAASSLPPRPDLFSSLAEAMHRRLVSVYSILLVRHDLDTAYLGEEAAAHRGEVLQPSLILALIAWERR